MNTEKMTATPMRSKQMMLDYYYFSKQRSERIKNGEKQYPAYEDPSEKKIAEFTHWYILENMYPYDTVADIHHIIISKRRFALDWDLIKNDELKELNFLKNKGYISENYDVVLENLPNGQTVPGRFHLHLIKLKRFEIEE